LERFVGNFLFLAHLLSDSAGVPEFLQR